MLSVHNLAHRPSSSSSSSRDLLLQGRTTVEACTASQGWHCPTHSGRSFGSRGRCYEYARGPPPPTQNTRRDATREWDDPVDDHEVFSLRELEEFQHTSFADTLPISAHKRKPPSRDASESPRKRPRLYEQSLYRVIPQPHICAAPDDTPPPRTTVQRGLRTYLANNKPTIIAPYTQERVDEVLDDPYARSSILDPASDDPTLGPHGPSTPSPDDALSGQIVWTRSALVALWDFLHKLQEGGALGPISLSFHAAPVARHDAVPAASATPAVVAGHAVETPSLVSEDASSSSRRSDAAPAAPLAATDHLKVYHDAGSAMRLRHVLYAWAVETGTGPEKAEGVSVVGKERVLKGARLVLVDERARAMLTM